MAKRPMTQEQIDFYSSFKTTHDHLTVKIQLQKIEDIVFEGLKEDFGKIIPRQSKQGLAKRYLKAIDILD